MLVDSSSSSPMVLLANYGSTTRRSSSSNEKVNKPCFNFLEGSCRFGFYCRFLHDGIHNNPSQRPSTITAPTSNNLSSHDLANLNSLLAKLGIKCNMNGEATSVSQVTPSVSLSSGGNQPVACVVNPTGFGTQAQPMYSF